MGSEKGIVGQHKSDKEARRIDNKNANSSPSIKD